MCERERVYVFTRESECMCVSVFMRERESTSVFIRERESVCVCVYF